MQGWTSPFPAVSFMNLIPFVWNCLCLTTAQLPGLMTSQCCYSLIWSFHICSLSWFLAVFSHSQRCSCWSGWCLKQCFAHIIRCIHEFRRPSRGIETGSLSWTAPLPPDWCWNGLTHIPIQDFHLSNPSISLLVLCPASWFSIWPLTMISSCWLSYWI